MSMSLRARRPKLASGAALRLAAVLLLSAFSVRAATPTRKATGTELLQSPAGLTEVGFIDGAAYRIDVPT
ncbi:MAG TPA: hypothetical protein VIJ38_19020, partial [Acidobacteriaceae bacterium]